MVGSYKFSRPTIFFLGNYFELLFYLHLKKPFFLAKITNNLSVPFRSVDEPVNPRESRKRRTENLVKEDFTFFFICFTSILIVYNSYTLQNNIVIKIARVVYSYIVEVTNSCKYYTRYKLNLNY